MMKISSLIIIGLLAASMVTDIAAQNTDSYDHQIRPIDHIVAVVNEEVITQQEINEVLQNTMRQLQRQGTQLPGMEVLENQLLERMILKRIQLQRAKELGLSVSDGDLDQTIRKIAEDNNLSMEGFRQALAQEGTDLRTFREDIREEILMVRLKEQEVNSRVNVTESEIDNFLHTQQTSSIGNEEYRLAHILVQVSEQMDESQIEARRERAETALENLLQGKSFAQVSAEFSDAPNAMEGGELDWRPIGQMGPLFGELLVSMEPGDVTPVVRSPVGFHILRLLERRQQEMPVVIIDQTHAQHILIKISELMSEDDAYRQIMQIKERIDNGADFSEVAKSHSEDASATSGGDLGWISPGDTVPDFEQAMHRLLPGQISGPVRTPFGWHLIKVIEHRSQDISEQQHREAARRAIHGRKAEAVIQEWLQQLKDQAYIEYKIEDS
ncbi:peptidylprolyl isomerase [Nitrosomonas sp. ANs5]|uniref:peptidylprolyl isomerase n=1 Tax=Nitrosomonas sp. ANs5 TaxID=3423941 RepID=UPI003D34E815